MTGLRVCWQLTRGGFCGGSVTWTKRDGVWGSKCGRCQTESLAASGDVRELEADGPR